MLGGSTKRRIISPGGSNNPIYFLSVKTCLFHTLFGGSTKRRLIQIIDGIMLGRSTTPRLLLYFLSKESSILLCLVVSPNRMLVFSIRHNII